jgi:hypothetical protein
MRSDWSYLNVGKRYVLWAEAEDTIGISQEQYQLCLELCGFVGTLLSSGKIQMLNPRLGEVDWPFQLLEIKGLEAVKS